MQVPTKKRRLAERTPMMWSPCVAQGRRFEIVGDSNLLINWMNGNWRCKYNVYDQRLAMLHALVQNLITRCFMRPWSDHADWGRHVYRELNQEADLLAGKHFHKYTLHTLDTTFMCFRLFFDGSCAATGAGCGWVVYGASAVVSDSPADWTRIADLSFALCRGATVILAELESCLWGVAYLSVWLQGLSPARDCAFSWKPLDTSRFQVLELSGLLQ